MLLTNPQIQTLIVIERTTASISVFSTLLLITSFILFKPFRTLSNTLIFYASFANLFANVAALIGGSALTNLNGGLCQFQGFLLEMFMLSDPLWSCAMAFNVYLVFFHRYDADRLKRLYWLYGAMCYGIPFIPAMFCLFYRTKEKGRMYGNATLWCWIDNDWAPFRIYVYYAPIWISILVTFGLYSRVGVEIFQKRTELHKAGYDPNSVSRTLSTNNDPRTIENHQLPAIAPFSGLRTTEIEVTRTADPWSHPFPLPPSSTSHGPSHSVSPSVAPSLSTEKPPGPLPDPYTITIISSPPATPYPRASTTQPHLPKRPSTMDKIKWAYTRCALLFAISILLTWVPASVNRVHGLRYPAKPSFGLNVAAALVLPLQGFWNAVIYFWTSSGVCRDCWRTASERPAKLWRRRPSGNPTPNHCDRTDDSAHLAVDEGRAMGIGMRRIRIRSRSESVLGLSGRASEGSLSMGDSF
ncbi:hypothetical protein LZ554_005826 [Drepanopeziza brunnea f. sp. 'monogermtubi']|nr:hypothetical protein LZ554_005826 [Drepanopeziza brunnea f. sp. 'monogermtubi']